MIEKIKQKILEYPKELAIGCGIVVIIIFLMVFNSMPVENKDNVFKQSFTSKRNKTAVKTTKRPGYIYVDIQGEVNRPGFYRIKSAARMFDLLQIAGGLKETADRKNINQAKKLTDQEQVYVPKVGEIKDQPLISATDNVSDSSDSQQVNINAATVDELQNLPGVGPKKAEKIVQYREENGDFEKPEDLTKVSGFGEKSLETLKEQITV